MTPEALIRSATSWQQVPFVPEIRLLTAAEPFGLWDRTELDAPPFWAFPWAGGQALGQDLVRAVEVAEVNRAEQLAGRDALQLIRHQGSAEHGHPAVQRYLMDEPQPGVPPGVQAEGSDPQGAVRLEDVAVRQQAAQRLGDRGLAGAAGTGHHEQRKTRDPHAALALRAVQDGGKRISF